MTRAIPSAACTALRAKSSPMAAITAIGARIQKPRASALEVTGWPLPGSGRPSGRRRGRRRADRAPRRRGCPGRPGVAEVVVGRGVTCLDVVPLVLGRGRDPAEVVVALLEAVGHREGRWQHAALERSEQLVLGEDQLAAVVVGELVEVGHRERPGRAGLDAQPAEDAAQVVDLVDATVALAGRVAARAALVDGGVVVVGALDEDRVGRAGPGAQLAADALLEPVGVAVELVAPVEAGSRGARLLGVLLGLRPCGTSSRRTPRNRRRVRRGRRGTPHRDRPHRAGRSSCWWTQPWVSSLKMVEPPRPLDAVDRTGSAAMVRPGSTRRWPGSGGTG